MGLSSRQAQPRAPKTTMNIQKQIGWAAGAVVVALVIGCAIFAFKGDIKQTAGTITAPASQLDYVNITQGIGFGPNAQTQGSLSTNIMGVRSVIASSTSLCSMQNPFNATSTIINASLQATNSISIATAIGLYTGLTSGATTTAIASPITIAAGALAFLQASGVASSTDIGVAVAPNAFVTYGQTATNFAGMSGACNAMFESAN